MLPIKALLLSRFVSHRFAFFLAQRSKADLLLMKELLESEKVVPVIDRSYPLREVPDAIRYLEEGHAHGKVVITV
jgi:NADPH:quinone reductase-like Zn-dependent oxidoreductase